MIVTYAYKQTENEREKLYNDTQWRFLFKNV